MKIIKNLLRLKFYVALLGAGYLVHSCMNNDYRYRVRRVEGEPYLMDTEQNTIVRIYSVERTMQLGDTAYRIRNLYRAPDLQQVVEQLEKEQEVKK